MKRSAKGSHCRLEGVCRPVTGRQAHTPEALRNLLVGDLSDLHTCGSKLKGKTWRDSASGRSGDQDRRPGEGELSSTRNGDGTHADP